MLRKPLFILSLFAILLVLAFQTASAQNQPAFEIGVLDTPQGAISSGARLAMQAINAAGGVRGADGTQFHLDLVIEPPDFSSATSQSIAALRAAGVIAVLGPQNDDDVANNLSLLQSLTVPVLTPATGDTLLTSDTSGFLFRSRAANALEGQALASYLIGEHNLRDIATVQLDVASTAQIVGFTNAAKALGVTPAPAILLGSAAELDADVQALLVKNPAVIVVYGNPSLASNLYKGIRSGGWKGVFAYNQAFNSSFRVIVPFDQLSGVIMTTTWPFTATDQQSVRFLNDYIRAYGTLPGEIEAASYDSIILIADALTRPGSLRDNLAAKQPLQGVQGMLNTPDLPGSELSGNVAITRLGNLGAPQVLARYEGNQRLPAALPAAPVENTAIPVLTATTAPTATPQGVTLTIKGARQNVRTGPGDTYQILGQLNQGDQAPIIGASGDYTWVVINYQGRQGWLAAYLLDIFGDLHSVPIIPTPPTPIIPTPPTPTPAPYADLIINSVAASPSPIIPGQNFTVNVTVSNIGGTTAGTFNVGGTFPPNNIPLIATVSGLGPGQTTTVSLTGVLTTAGTYSTSLQIDLNNQVAEGPVGEQNNIYNFTYQVGTPTPTILNQGQAKLGIGDTVDLEGNAVQGDANWNADGGTLGLKGIFGAKLALLSGTDYNAVTWDTLNATTINRDSIARTELDVGTLIAIITADGHHGVMQVNEVSDTNITLTYRVYSL